MSAALVRVVAVDERMLDREDSLLPSWRRWRETPRLSHERVIEFAKDRPLRTGSPASGPQTPFVVQLGRLLGSSVDAGSASQGGSHRACVILRCLMSEESTTPDPVELMGRAFEAANRRDLDAAASSFAEDATFDGRALGDRFQGRAAIRSFLEDWFGAYEELEFGLEEVRDLGNGVVFAVVVQNGRPAGSAGHLRQREGWVFVWVRGLIARLTISEVDEARAAAERLAQERG